MKLVYRRGKEGRATDSPFMRWSNTALYCGVNAVREHDQRGTYASDGRNKLKEDEYATNYNPLLSRFQTVYALDRSY